MVASSDFKALPYHSFKATLKGSYFPYLTTTQV